MPLNPSNASSDRLELLFHQALELPEEDRPAFLRVACRDESHLREAVESLLSAAGRAERNPLWNESAVENEARFMVDRLRSGDGLERYRLLEQIGAGGMGVVFRAIRSDDEFSKVVAIKIVQAADPATVQRLRHERQILATLEHQYIARLLDGGTTADGLPFLVMEYVDGVPVDRFVRDRKLPPRQALDLFCKICDAISYAHRNLVIHRDLKPANIAVTPDGQPKVLDFGIAKLLADSPATLTATRALTPEYASPEQVRGAAMTTATDVYSLGVVLYHLLTGARPYRATTNPLDLARSIVNDPPAPLAVRAGRPFDADLENIVQMALRKEPERRYASVDQFREDIRRYLDGFPIIARSPTRLYRIGKFAKRNKALLAASGLIAVALLAGAAATLYQARIASQRFEDVRQLAHAVIFDYHDAIEPLAGSTPVRQKLVKDALVYLNKLSAQKTDPDLKRELVEAYVKIANVQGNGYQSNLGDSSGALSSIERAISLGQQLVRTDRSAVGRRALASAYLTRGDLLSETNRLEDAARDYRTSIDMEESVVRDLPDDLDSSIQLADSLRHYGDVLGKEGESNLGRSAAALEAYRRAVAVAENVRQRHPGLHPVERELYDCYLALSAADLTAGHLGAAEQEQRRAVEMIQRVADKAPYQSPDKVELAGASLQLVQVLLDNGKPKEALPYVLNAQSIMQAQVNADPSNALYRRNLAVTETHVANVLRRSGDPRHAADHARAALAMSEALSRKDPHNSESLSDVANSHLKLAEALADDRKLSEALDHDRTAISILRSMNKRDDDTNTLRLLVRAEIAAADTEARVGNIFLAASDYDSAAQLAAEATKRDPGEAFAQMELARSEIGLAGYYVRQARWRDAQKYYRQAIDKLSPLRDQKALPPDVEERFSRAVHDLKAVEEKTASHSAAVPKGRP